MESIDIECFELAPRTPSPRLLPRYSKILKATFPDARITAICRGLLIRLLPTNPRFPSHSPSACSNNQCQPSLSRWSRRPSPPFPTPPLPPTSSLCPLCPTQYSPLIFFPIDQTPGPTPLPSSSAPTIAHSPTAPTRPLPPTSPPPPPFPSPRCAECLSTAT
jgi:hypothetical protein